MDLLCLKVLSSWNLNLCCFVNCMFECINGLSILKNLGSNIIHTQPLKSAIPTISSGISENIPRKEQHLHMFKCYHVHMYDMHIFIYLFYNISNISPIHLVTFYAERICQSNESRVFIYLIFQYNTHLYLSDINSQI